MQEKREQFLSYLREQKAETLMQIQTLEADERRDEAVFLKAKANIYDICKALFEVSEKMSAGDAVKVTEEFLKKADFVPENWRITAPAVSFHLKKLEDAGAVSSRKEQYYTMYSLKKERIVLEELAKLFEANKKYTEREVNLILADVYDDFCALRRDMVDEGLLAREGMAYWKV